MTDVASSAGVMLAWAALFLGVLLILAYRRSGLALSSGVLGLLLLAYLALGSAPVWWKIAVSLPYALLLLLNIRPLRRRAVTRPFLRSYRKLLPPMSATEREALDAGTVWWDGELFTGGPDWHKLMSAKVPTLTAEEQLLYSRQISFVGSRYSYRERLIKELQAFPIKLWGAGWSRTESLEIRALVVGGPVWGRAKLAVYSGSTLSLNHHHPMNDIVGVNTRAFELAASGACQVVDLKGELPGLFTPGEEVVVYRDLDELKNQLGYYLAHPDEARAIGGNAMKRALQEHTLRHRIEEILTVVEQRFGKR